MHGQARLGNPSLSSITHCEGLGMRNLQYEIKICQKSHNEISLLYSVVGFSQICAVIGWKIRKEYVKFVRYEEVLGFFSPNMYFDKNEQYMTSNVQKVRSSARNLSKSLKHSCAMFFQLLSLISSYITTVHILTWNET